MKYFVEQIIESLHMALLAHVGIEQTESKLSEELTKEDLQSLLLLFMKAAADMRYGVVTELPLELAVLEWTSNSMVDTQPSSPSTSLREEKVEEVTVTKTTTTMNPKDTSFLEAAKPAENTVASMRKQVGNIMKVKALYGEPKEEKVEKALSKLRLEAYNNDGPLSTEWIQEFWRCLIEQMKTHNHTIAGVLRGCGISSFDKETLIIETAYKFHQEKLADTKIKILLESTCKELVGKPVAVTIMLKQ